MIYAPILRALSMAQGSPKQSDDDSSMDLSLSIPLNVIEIAASEKDGGKFARSNLALVEDGKSEAKKEKVFPAKSESLLIGSSMVGNLI